MNWIKSNEREPLNEGKYHCKYNGVKVVLDFVKIQPKKEHFVMNENYNDISSTAINAGVETIQKIGREVGNIFKKSSSKKSK